MVIEAYRDVGMAEEHPSMGATSHPSPPAGWQSLSPSKRRWSDRRGPCQVRLGRAVWVVF